MGGTLLLHRLGDAPGDDFAAACQVPAVLHQLTPGHRVFIDDGTLGTVVEAVGPRGDLAIGIGLERLAEMQEELMRLAAAAAVPVIWATQVLEQLVTKGLLLRGEMTDAAMAVCAEAVMLNKGPHVVDGVADLARLPTRMADHPDGRLLRQEDAEASGTDGLAHGSTSATLTPPCYKIVVACQEIALNK